MLRRSAAFALLLACCPTPALAEVPPAAETALPIVAEVDADGAQKPLADAIRAHIGALRDPVMPPQELRILRNAVNRRNVVNDLDLALVPAGDARRLQLKASFADKGPNFLGLPGSVTIAPWVTSFLVEDENFLGLGHDAALRAKYLVEESYSLHYDADHLGPLPFFLGVDAFYYANRRDLRRDNVAYASYDEYRWAADAVAGWHLNPAWSVGLNGRIGGIETRPQGGVATPGSEQTRVASLFAVYDTRPAIYNADEGRALRFAHEVHAPEGAASYNKTQLDGLQHIPFGGGHGLAIRGTVGWFGGQVPYWNLYRVGGTGVREWYDADKQLAYGLVEPNMRAYNRGAFVGDRIANASVEYRFPLFDFPKLPVFGVAPISGVLGVDVGGSWLGAEPIDYRKLRWSGVVGLRAKTPLLTGRVDVGFARDSVNFWLGLDQVF